MGVVPARLMAKRPTRTHVMLWTRIPSPEAAVEDIDWSKCDDVERIPGKVSGQPIVKGTRILAGGVVVNAESGLTPEEIANEIFPGLGVDRARRIIAFARQHAPHPA